MNDKKKISKDEFQSLVEGIIDKIGEPARPGPQLPIEKKSLEKFCELTDHDYSFYAERGLIPQGYLMTFTIPIMNQFFIVGAADLIPKVITGIIHTSSKIEFFRPFEMDREYFAKMGVKNIEEKKGRKGDYFTVDFEVVVTNENGEKVASDVHQFFLKT